MKSVPWTLILTIDAFTIALFLISYYKNCYRRGYRIDLWHSQLFLVCVFPNMILLPFARDPLNELVLHDDFSRVVDVVPTVFMITVIGYFAMLAGGGLWRIQTGIGIRKAILPILEILPRFSMMLMSSRILLRFQVILCLVFQGAIVLLYFAQSGVGFDLRGYTFEHPALRPIAQIIASYSVTIGSHCLARYVDRKEKDLLVCTLLISVGLVFFGSRAILLGIYLGVLLCYLVRLRTRLKIFWFFALVFFMVCIGLYLGNVRAGHTSLIELFGSLAFLVFYGNNFSDLRDFAWVYSAWDHQWWGGRTYLAALTSFIPRFASAFRDTWGLGVATDRTVGLDPQVHPGLRPGSFGEGYFNFGFLGVIVVGLLIGFLSRRVDIDTKLALSSSRSSMMEAFASIQLLQVAGCIAISVNLSGFYVLCGIYLFSWICLQILRLIRVVPYQSRNLGWRNP